MKMGVEGWLWPWLQIYSVNGEDAVLQFEVHIPLSTVLSVCFVMLLVLLNGSIYSSVTS